MKGNSQEQAVSVVQQKDLYEVLGIPRTATPDQIKSAYKKLALRHHPDKAPPAQKEAAAEHFQEICAAYAVLSDPIKRSKYDDRGLQAFAPSELSDVQIDPSSLGFFSTFAAAMFTKLGVPLKTAVPASVTEQAYEGKFTPRTLLFGQSIPDRVEKRQAQFYEVQVSQEHIQHGFVVGAHSGVGSKIKLLLFEQTGPCRWEIEEQEDSCSMPKGGSLANLYFLPNKTYTVGPKISTLESASKPELQLFQRLETMEPREKIAVKPGKLLFAVYNDNWYNRAQYTLSAVLPSKQPESAAALADLRMAEDNLLDNQISIRAFQSEYREAEERWRKAVEKFKDLSLQVESNLALRHTAQLGIISSRTGPSI